MALFLLQLVFYSCCCFVALFMVKVCVVEWPSDFVTPKIVERQRLFIQFQDHIMKAVRPILHRCTRQKVVLH